jgi:RNA polymerase sigma-70 factor (ECF subfamily)
LRRFEDIYDEHVWAVHGFFMYRTGSRPDAEDLTQVTFERALRAWPRYDPARSQPLTWLMSIGKNVLIDDYRRAQARTGGLQPVSLEAAGDQSGEETPSDPGLHPDLEAALVALGEREREVIALRFGADLDGPAIAAFMELTLANVQQILSRALRKLHTRLAGSSLADERVR